MSLNRWWTCGAWVAAWLAVTLTAAAVWAGVRSAGQPQALVVAGSQLGFALLCWAAAVGLWRRRPWSIHLGTGLGLFYVLLAAVVGLNLNAVLEASRELGVEYPALQMALVGARGAAGLLLLLALMALSRTTSRRPALA